MEINLICSECIYELKVAYLFTLKLEEANTIIIDFIKAGKETKTIKESLPLDYKIQNNTSIVTPIEPLHSPQKQLASSNPSKILHICPICYQEFTALELRLHVHTHKALKKYLNIALDDRITSSSKFSTIRHLDEAKQPNIAQEKRKHRCPYCQIEYIAKEFRLHVENHRKKVNYKCAKCPRTFRRMNHLKIHSLKHIKEFPFTCEHCEKGFVIKENYNCHILLHTNKTLPHECNFCLRRFSNPKHLIRHRVIHTENVTYSVKYKICKCNSCRQTFEDRKQLQSHICNPIKYTASTKFLCKICKKIFSNSSAYKRHNCKIHKLSSAQALCSVCGHYVRNIYAHMVRHSVKKRYQCDQCEKQFRGKPQLNQHLLVHSGQKPFICSICGKSFNNLYNLQVHERIHKGNRCHICEICGKGFLERSYLKKHLLVHKKEIQFIATNTDL